MRQHRVDHLIDGVAGFYHHHDAARPLEQARKLLNGMGADDLSAFGLIVDEVVHF